MKDKCEDRARQGRGQWVDEVQRAACTGSGKQCLFFWNCEMLVMTGTWDLSAVLNVGWSSV